jgi:Pyruvate:ferredoxin oxidoreductase and related 2-oxoacid:ferredoxin oxidoreductases, gamma subunit
MNKIDNINNNYKKVFRIVSENSESSLKKGEITSVLFAGVGGQGIILAGTVLARAAINAGYDVKVSEVHGMSQRGGSVEGSVRFGKKVFSPTINKADFIIALEKLEALRYIMKLEKNGFILVNNYEIYPSSVSSRDMPYPADIESRVKEITGKSLFIDAVEIAKRFNQIKVSNIVMLGVFSNLLPFGQEHWTGAIKESAPAKAVELNLEAFMAGKKLFI